MPNAIVYGRNIVLVLVCACGTTKSVDAPPGGDNTIAGTCVVDSSKDEATAIDWTGPLQGQICPRADVDYYNVTVPAGNDLLDVTAGYGTSVTRVDLSVQVIGAGSVVDSAIDDNQSNIKGTLQITPGVHMVVVRDLNDDERDDANKYTLDFAFGKDPDTHEPNDTQATAKAVDGKPGWFAYAGDQDFYRITVTTPNLLIELQNAAGSQAIVKYSLQGPTGQVLGGGSANPGATLKEQRPIPSPGDYFVVLTQEAARAPDRRAEASYTLALTLKPETDPHDTPTRNDTGATTSCFVGAAPVCDAGFTGADLALPAQTGRIATVGDRDYYALTIGGSGAVVVEVALAFAASSPLQAAFDILVAQPGSTCSADNQCDSLNVACTDDSDCEMSHTCLPAGPYASCPQGQNCRRCVGGNACLPGGLCAAPHYLAHVLQSGNNSLKTAQPLFDPGTYYIVVHDFQDNEYDDASDYQLQVTLHPELDPGDVNPRNNFYNPYPLQTSSLAKSAQRATDITALLSATGVTGMISYETDEDWYKFDYPCKGASGPVTCGITFDWDQPASTGLRVVFLMRNDDLSVHESFVFTGASTAAQTNLTFGGVAACDQCSFADVRNTGGNANYQYFLQVRDYGNDDYEVAKPYRIHMTKGPDGCPAACNHTPDGTCGCYCPGTGCPAGPTGKLPPP